MKYTETKGDLFSAPSDYYLAHCISADFGMGKGIVVEFNKRFDMKNKLKRYHPHYLAYYDSQVKLGIEGTCLIEGRVLNLITKRNYWLKPTYKSMAQALADMRTIVLTHHIKKIAMPVIGCGLDRLNWDKVSTIIKDTFNDLDVEITVYSI